MQEPAEVMVLDDERIACERLSDFLQKQGMHVETFTDGKAALARLQERRFHVLLTDLRMAGLTGIDMLLELKRGGLPTEVIIMTAYRTSEATREAQYAHAFGFLDKPLRLPELHSLVTKAAKKAVRNMQAQAG
jgi:DNA-binding NtrC family response regulator